LEIARKHSSYGYKRLTTELNENYGHQINKKVVLKLTRDNQLQLLRKVKKPKPSFVTKTLVAMGDKMNIVGQMLAEGKVINPFEVCYTDFTEIIYCYGKRRLQLMPIIEHVSKIALGWALGNTATTEVALKAWVKDNPEMESFNGHFKGENKTLFWECEKPEEVSRVVDERMVYYNTERRHLSLGNKSPLTYLKNW